MIRRTLDWKSGGADFRAGKYSREHTWTFDGGVTVPASASPSVVPAPWSNPAGIDPEEAFVAAVASCHLLTFLYVAYREGFEVEGYRDEAAGVMTKNEKGVPWVSRITLRPRIVFGGAKRPSPDEERHLHRLAHEQCFLANSIHTEVVLEPPGGDEGGRSATDVNGHTPEPG